MGFDCRSALRSVPNLTPPPTGSETTRTFSNCHRNEGQLAAFSRPIFRPPPSSRRPSPIHLPASFQPPPPAGAFPRAELWGRKGGGEGGLEVDPPNSQPASQLQPAALLSRQQPVEPSAAAPPFPPPGTIEKHPDPPSPPEPLPPPRRRPGSNSTAQVGDVLFLTKPLGVGPGPSLIYSSLRHFFYLLTFRFMSYQFSPFYFASFFRNIRFEFFYISELQGASQASLLVGGGPVADPNDRGQEGAPSRRAQRPRPPRPGCMLERGGG